MSDPWAVAVTETREAEMTEVNNLLAMSKRLEQDEAEELARLQGHSHDQPMASKDFERMISLIEKRREQINQAEHAARLEKIRQDQETLQGYMKNPGASATQVGGDHYKKLGDYQPWDVFKHWGTKEEYRGFLKFSAVAYLARERDKGGIEDVKKAIHFLQKLVETDVS